MEHSCRHAPGWMGKRALDSRCGKSDGGFDDNRKTRLLASHDRSDADRGRYNIWMFHKPFFKPIFLLGLLSLLARAWISAARRNPKRYPLAPWKWLPAMIYRYVLWRCCRVSGIWAFPASGVSCLRWRNMGLTRAQCLDGRRPRLSLNRRGRPRRGRYGDRRPTSRRRHRRFMLSRCRRRFADTQQGRPRDGGSVATVAIN